MKLRSKYTPSKEMSDAQVHVHVQYAKYIKIGTGF